MKSFEPRTGILPATQQALWAELKPLREFGYVLYGGTAIALRLGHRQSVDFDFFNAGPVDRLQLRRSLSFLRHAIVRQDHGDAFEVATDTGVKVSFFGSIDFGHIERPEQTVDGVMLIAALDDLMATKVKVILQRSEAKDYQDVAAMVRSGVRLERGLAAAEKMFQPAFSPSESLKALVYFEGGDLKRLSTADRELLIAAASRVKSLPDVEVFPGLGG